MPQSRQRTGQALAEYGLLIALIGIASLAVLFIFAGDLSSSINAMGRDGVGGFSGIMGQNGSSPPSSTGSLGGSTQTPAQSSHGGTAGAGSSPPLTLANYPANLSQAVETTGGNGTTKQVLASLDALIPQLLQNGQIDAAQANLLKKLSNQGHHIAAIEKAIEDAASQATDPNAFYYQDITFQGQTYKVNQLAQFLNNDSAGGMGGYFNLTPTTGSEMAQFLTLYQQAQQSITDPTAQQIVQQHADDIALIAASMEGTLDMMWRTNPPPPSTLNTQMASIVTNHHSATICTTGGHGSSGTGCQ